MVNTSVIKGSKIIAKTLLWLLLIGALLITIVVWKIADNVVHPPRRELQDYHHYWLQHSADEGINITEYACASGNMPCLFVTPHPDAQLGANGQLIREQLTQDFGHELSNYQDYASKPSKPQGIVVLLHGRMGRKEDMLPIAARLVASGFVCVLLDMPAHGDSPLASSQFGTELNQNQPNLIVQSLQDMRHWLNQQQTMRQSMQQDAQLNSQQPLSQSLSQPLSEPSPRSLSQPSSQLMSADTLPAYLWGMSMGGSYANYSLSDPTSQPHWEGLIIVSSFAHMQALVDSQADHIVAFLPDTLKNVAKPILLNMLSVFIDWQGGTAPRAVNPAEVAGAHHLPVLQFHGDSDTLIDIEQGKQLFDSYSSPDKTWIPVVGAGHNDVLVTEAPVYATMADWLIEHGKNDTTNDNLSDNTQTQND